MLMAHIYKARAMPAISLSKFGTVQIENLIVGNFGVDNLYGFKKSITQKKVLLG